MYAIRSYYVKTRNEIQLTDALMRMITGGTKFTTLEVFNWFDCGQKDILLETNATLLDRKKNQADPERIRNNFV